VITFHECGILLEDYRSFVFHTSTIWLSKNTR